MNPFNSALRELWQRAERPSQRAVSLRTDSRISHTSIGEILNGRSFPRWNTAHVLIEALGGDPFNMRNLWEEEAEIQQQRREEQREHGRRSRRWRVATGQPVRPGDTLLFTVPDPADPGHLEDLQVQLSREFPRNTVKIVGGAQLAVMREEPAA